MVSQWYDTPVSGGNLYAYGANFTQNTNLSAIAGGWKEVDCVTTKAVYFCRTVSGWQMPADLEVPAARHRCCMRSALTVPAYLRALPSPCTCHLPH